MTQSSSSGKKPTPSFLPSGKKPLSTSTRSATPKPPTAKTTQDDEFVIFDGNVAPPAHTPPSPNPPAPEKLATSAQPVTPQRITPVMKSPSPTHAAVENQTKPLGNAPESGMLAQAGHHDKTSHATLKTKADGKTNAPQNTNQGKAKPVREYDETTPRPMGFFITPLRFLMLAALLGVSYVVVWLHAYDLGVVAGQEELPPVLYADRQAENLLETTPTEPSTTAPPEESELNIYKVLRGENETTAALSAPTTTNDRPSDTGLPAQTADGRYSVQLASLRTNSDAVRRRNQIQDAQRSILDNYVIEIERADLGERGTYYRLLLNGFAERRGATRICSRLSAAGQDCLVKWNE